MELIARMILSRFRTFSEILRRVWEEHGPEVYKPGILCKEPPVDLRIRKQTQDVHLATLSNVHERYIGPPRAE